ncbi:hypothetical protein QK292_16085 [Arthrobacter sp. AL08]|uniref:hypothetical protein n=1 Tax=unclassified Arthrobacter TaxID=235627 RepID=UPI001CFF6095|nr:MULTISPECIES: hypothetical protein [unclassified Arthrobacter]MDI3243101.1 hypothetical protein [Arthrobacter sp. AL05]MDI3279085.1 hypothetical protein [Arthrobacter sp. AL08]WGZ80987.1 hypothetical protein QI450_07415 [Arthrobacter sp. EM1]
MSGTGPGAADFSNAPPATLAGSLMVVPVHVLELRAEVSFDAVRGTSVAAATMDYRVGPTGGNPFFDLRQSVDSCWLDGVPLDPEMIGGCDVGAGPAGSVRVLRRFQDRGSVHSLRFRYRLGLPHAELGGASPPVLEWSDGPALRWTLGMSDLFAGRYLEAWFPSNLPFDQFPVTLNITLTGTEVAHVLISNGDVAVGGPGRWSVAFPASFTTLSHLVELRPAATVEGQKSTVVLPVSGTAVTVEAWKCSAGPEDLGHELGRIESLLAQNEADYGRFPGNRFVCFFNGNRGGMEYHHGATTSRRALAHEVFHSWFSRGVMPASQADGWWDEAFTSYHEHGAGQLEAFDFNEAPVELCSRRPFDRRTAVNAYPDGSRFFRGLADALGVERLRACMRAVYARHCSAPLSTIGLEADILVAGGEPSVVDAFHRFVYGLPDPSPAPKLRLHGLAARGAGDRIRVSVSNDSGGGPCRHFMVVFSLAGAATGAERAAGACRNIAATGGFDLQPGEEREVWTTASEALIQRSWTGTMLVASVHARGCDPSPRTRVSALLPPAQATSASQFPAPA